jgi:hypothetical protein
VTATTPAAIITITDGANPSRRNQVKAASAANACRIDCLRATAGPTMTITVGGNQTSNQTRRGRSVGLHVDVLRLRRRAAYPITVVFPHPRSIHDKAQPWLSQTLMACL